MNKVASGVLVLGLAALLAAACGGQSSSKKESGESHFLSFCESTCAEGLSCLCGVCTARCSASDECPSAGECVPGSCAAAPRACDRPCSSNEACSPLGDGYRCEEGACRFGEPPQRGTGGAPPVPPGPCPEGCQVVTFYPEVPPAQGCLDVYLHDLFKACACGEPELGRTCVKLGEDLLRVPLGVEFPDSDVTECTPDEQKRALHACEVVHCEVPPPSACSVEDTCEQLGCGGLEFDADGCRRPECESDAGCAEDERCITTSVTTSFCDYAPNGEACNCSGPRVEQRASLCNPVSAVGPRGPWEALRFSSEALEGCFENCVRTWTLTPDGTIERAVGETLEATMIVDEIQLTGEELDTVSQLVDGVELRPGLRDGFACEGALDASLTVSLDLPGVTLARVVTECVAVEGHVVRELAAIVMRE